MTHRTTSNSVTTMQDPSNYLDDDCMGQIFSFVGGVMNKRDPKPISTIRKSKQRRLSTPTQRYELPGPGPYWKVKEAAYLCCVLAAVSPKWEELVNQSTSDVVSVPIDLNLDDFKSEESARAWLSWLCQHKPRIGRLRFRQPWPSLTKELVDLLQKCDTSNLEHLELYLTKEQEELQSVLADQCPNLQTLSIYVSAQKGEDSLQGMLSPTLASLPSIQDLEICLVVSKFELSEKDGMLLNQLVEKVDVVTPLDEGVLEILSLRHPKELRFEPLPSDNSKKFALALATERSFRSSTFGFR